MAGARRALWPLSSPCSTSYMTLIWEVPSMYPEGRSILISKNRGIRILRGTQRNRPCYVSPSLLLLVPISFALSRFPGLSTFIRPRIKRLRLTSNHFWGLFYLWRLLCHIKLTLNKCLCFFSVKLCCQFNIQVQSEILRELRKSFLSPMVCILFMYSFILNNVLILRMSYKLWPEII